ncbi:class I SAM-dependent methyltransferase [Futiania mangrovi]|uniref:Class I SAM-dependent methyltransferase n=1 Tax=Futiania mangrovi TaxID=2959716 RepID=A0A9J6PBV2_9PROT|nr:class I SAM-dependent methyltransferase [Futiania mangrovii]MCP1336741.1 class I SAM-dependent methyltransferase [Futiania mangrovii]
MKDRIGQALDLTHRAVTSGRQGVLSRQLTDLILMLGDVRRSMAPQDWAAIVRLCRQHPLLDALHADPLTSRAYTKPDGYPGDARLLDLIYGRGNYAAALAEADALGRSVYAYTRMAPSCMAVRNRCDMAADAIGETLRTRDSARILSVACGNLREAERVPWAFVGNLDRFTALDMDEVSLADIEARRLHPNVACVKAPIRDLILDTIDETDFDLIYALGIYDYLNRRTARRLTRSLAKRLRPGGRLVVANFAKDAIDIGYMETYMDWYLIYRDEADMLDAASDIDEGATASRRVYRDISGQLVFLDLVKAG